MTLITFTVDTHLIVKGSSSYIKDILQLHGGVWSKTPGSKNPDDFGFWTLPIEHDSREFRYMLENASESAFKLVLEREAREQKKRHEEYMISENQKLEAMRTGIVFCQS